MNVPFSLSLLVFEVGRGASEVGLLSEKLGDLAFKNKPYGIVYAVLAEDMKQSILGLREKF